MSDLPVVWSTKHRTLRQSELDSTGQNWIEHLQMLSVLIRWVQYNLEPLAWCPMAQTEGISASKISTHRSAPAELPFVLR